MRSDAARQRRVAELVSHHLRTPLTVVRGGLAILDETRRLSTSERQEVMTDIRQETERLVRVVDDLMVLLAPQASPVRTEPVLLQRLLPATLGSDLPDGTRAIDCRLDRDLPPVSGDADRIAHVVRNLAWAAAHADREGAVSVRASAGDRRVDLVVRPAGGADVPPLPSEADARALALRSARRIASAMGGRVALRRRNGYALTLQLPIAVEGP